MSTSNEQQQLLTSNKRKSTPPPPPEHSLDDDNKAKQLKSMVTPSPLRAIDPITSGKNDEASLQLPSEIATTKPELCSKFLAPKSNSIDAFFITQPQNDDEKREHKLCVAANEAKPTVRSCQMCNVVKPLECFSNAQITKGGKCEVCCSAGQKNIETEGSPLVFGEEDRGKQVEKEMHQCAMEMRDKEKVMLSDDNKTMEDLEERKCAEKATKKKVDFDVKGKEDSIRAAVKKNAHEEESNIQKVKHAYEVYVATLKASGISIETEMSKQSDLLYVVTSISRREGDVFGPCLHGIYSTCQKSQEAAREVFQEVSESYRDGHFVTRDTRVAKCDMTNFLLPGVEGAFRPLFEVLGPDESDEDCTAVAINAVRIGSDVEQSLPFIQDSSSAWIKAGLDADTIPQRSLASAPVKNLKVHALFSYKVCDSGEERDVKLIGIYEDREEAINRARTYSKGFIHDEKMDVSYNFEVTDGELIVVDGAVSVSLETVILDDEDRTAYGNEIEISIL